MVRNVRYASTLRFNAMTVIPQMRKHNGHGCPFHIEDAILESTIPTLVLSDPGRWRAKLGLLEKSTSTILSR